MLPIEVHINVYKLRLKHDYSTDLSQGKYHTDPI